ncbi:hypothetical protein DAEQUDRAFT_283965 [Daedalea quercina L-15889]|uniref:Uncharacterized protein n=1 Tax=Daedalea quercina L-15889 TaxID=1314783 RepID=A0A165QAF1_9APHY|nr:hypothetical protein DAEQUDRAFT_283965 [Daedalea quercina L-15889]
MAVGPSATATSSIPTASATGSTTSTSTSSSGGGPSFSANGTAALILAFLAIGLFVGGMVAMIGLRRRALGRAQRWMTSETPTPVWAHDYPEAEDSSGRDTGARRKKKREIGRRPKLYDIYAPAKGIEPTSWQCTLPISARRILQCTPPTTSMLEPQDVAQGAHHRWHFDALSLFHWSPGPTPPSPPVAPPQETVPVEVAVVIAMPSPVGEEYPRLDYGLGLTRLSWDYGIAALDDLNCMALPEEQSDKPL